MSKGELPIPQILALVIMIIVIPIAIVFLLVNGGKLGDFITDFFGRAARNILPQDGKALHVELQRDGNDIILSEFHTTNENIHMQQNDMSVGDISHVISWFQIDPPDFSRNDACILFTTQARPSALGGSRGNLGYIYYIRPGTTIQDGSCNSLHGCISGKIIESSCQKVNTCIKLGTQSELGKFNICLDVKPFGITDVCDTKDNQVELAPFGPAKEFQNTCAKTVLCNLASDSYRVKYGLLCGNDAKWHACITEGTTQDGAKCTKNGENLFTWDTTNLVTKPQCVAPYLIDSTNWLEQNNYKSLAVKWSQVGYKNPVYKIRWYGVIGSSGEATTTTNSYTICRSGSTTQGCGVNGLEPNSQYTIEVDVERADDCIGPSPKVSTTTTFSLPQGSSTSACPSGSNAQCDSTLVRMIGNNNLCNYNFQGCIAQSCQYSSQSTIFTNQVCTPTGVTCDSLHADCDSNPINGCEINIKTDSNNCGFCGNVCPDNKPFCNNGQCSSIQPTFTPISGPQ